MKNPDCMYSKVGQAYKPADNMTDFWGKNDEEGESHERAPLAAVCLGLYIGGDRFCEIIE